MSTPDPEVVEVLCRIWAEALSLPEVAPDENYFDLGGDSLGAISIAAKAQASGIDLDAAAILELQSVAAVAPVARRTTAPVATAVGDPITGAQLVPLLPAQARFLDRGFRHPEQNNVAGWLDVPTDVDETGWQAIATALARRHDAFATTITLSGDTWLQTFDPEVVPGYRRVAAPGAGPAELAEVAAEAQTRRVLDGGSLLNLDHVDLGAGNGRLLVTAHHLVMDALSWQVLMRDLTLAYRQAAAGGPVELPAAATSMRRWAEAVTAYANGDRAAELSRWLSLPWEAAAEIAPPPPDRPFFVQESTELPPPLTDAFLRWSDRAHRRMRGALTVALGRAVSAWRGGGGALVDVMVHGRDGLGTALDLSETIGWLATDTPVVLGEADLAKPASGIASCHDQLDRPDDVEFSALRFVAGDSRLRSVPQPRALLNVRTATAPYAAGPGGFRMTGDPVGQPATDVNPYAIRLAVDLGTEKVELLWRYHDAAAAEAHGMLAGTFLATLDEVVRS